MLIGEMKAVLLMISTVIVEVIRIPPSIYDPMPRIASTCSSIDSFSDQEIPVYFRFRNNE